MVLPRMYLPLPLRIRYFWNLGRILGLLIGVQITTGLILSIHYVPHIRHRFSMVFNIMVDLEGGSVLRFMHCNGSRLLFLIIYLHIFKGMYYNSYSTNKSTWLFGCAAYILMILIAFLGYVLPWGQMRYWGATVITRLITTVPGVGKWLLIIIWGDYSVNNRSLNRFYTLHFIIPFVMIVIIIIHLVFLHSKGRTCEISSNKLIIPFRNYFMWKDSVGFVILIMVLLANITYFPEYFLDSENSIRARPLVTPVHIVPEWYFLYAYCVLKSIERKVIGVFILLCRVAFFPILAIKQNQHNSVGHKIVIIIWLVNFIILTKIGSLELIYPYSFFRVFCTLIHFIPLIY